MYKIDDKAIIEGFKVLVDSLRNLISNFIKAVREVFKNFKIGVNVLIKKYINTSKNLDGIVLHKYKTWEKKRFYY